MKTVIYLPIFALILSTSYGADVIYTPPNPPSNAAIVPAAKEDWYITVQQKFTKYGDKQADIVFDGDSITNRWESAGHDYWTRFAGRAADFGIEGDKTENLLWRLTKGQLDGVNPKVVVLMIGTNNVFRDGPQQIADGVKAVVEEYRKRCPDAHIVLMGIFPRGLPNDGPRKRLAAVNAIIKTFDDGAHVSYVDIGPKLVKPDGTIAPDMMPDALHPTAKGYLIWLNSIQPFLDKYAPAKS